MSPARAALEGPFSRSLREALESVASEAMVPRLVAMSLAAAGRGVVPEDATPFAAFVEGPLRTVIVQTLGIAAYEVVGERLAHVLAMATSQVRVREEREEDSQVRPTCPPRDDAGFSLDLGDLEFDLPLPPPPRPARARTVSSHSFAPPEPLVPASAASAEAPPPSGSIVLGAIDSSSGPRALARIQAQRAPRGAVEERGSGSSEDPRTRGPSSRSARSFSRVLVVTLDPLLIAETEGRLRHSSAEGGGAVQVVSIATSAELLANLREATGRVALVVDTALPSIDVPTFAALASAFPPGTVVVLWGMSERQKQRLVTMFPNAEPWIASGVAASPIDVLD